MTNYEKIVILKTYSRITLKKTRMDYIKHSVTLHRSQESGVTFSGKTMDEVVDGLYRHVHDIMEAACDLRQSAPLVQPTLLSYGVYGAVSGVKLAVYLGVPILVRNSST